MNSTRIAGGVRRICVPYLVRISSIASAFCFCQRTPPAILVEFMKTWDKMAAEESAKDPFFKKVLESQRVYAAKVVPAKRFMFPPYSFAANYYFPEKPVAAAKGEGKKK